MNEDFFGDIPMPTSKKSEDIEDLKTSISMLKSQVQALQTAISQIAQQNNAQQNNAQPTQNINSGFDQIKAFAEAMGSLRNYENTVINQYKAMRNEIIDNIGEEVGEPESPESALLRQVTPVILEKLLSKKEEKPQKSVSQPVEQKSNIPPPQNSGFSEAQNQKIEADVKMEVKDIVENIPSFVKQGIRSGEISLDMCKSMAVSEAEKRGLHVSEDLIEKVYHEVKQNDGKNREFDVPSDTKRDKKSSGSGKSKKKNR